MKDANMKEKIQRLLISNAVPIIFIALSAVAIPLSGFTASYLIQEMMTRVARNSFLVLSLLIPILAGMGLNFGMVLGAMAGQIGLILISDWSVSGLPGMLLAALIATPIAVFLGWVCGSVLNRAKGREMVTSYILGFFINGLYQLLVLYGMGKLIPIRKAELVLSRGYGIRNAINLQGIRHCLDELIPLKIGELSVPLATYLVIGAFCLFILWFQRTKLGQDMRAIGQDMAVADSAGIPVEKTRIIAIIISTVLACYGQIIFLQNIGTMNTYNSHDQAGMFAIAALLIGGATVAKATIGNVFLGVVLFHLMFVVSPMAGKQLIGQAQLGEYFRVFVSYGIIAISLALHAWKRQKDRERARRSLRGQAA
ncbi:permease component of ribose/xylose/arabinose/galactoside ABC-type transporter [Thermanaerovibrio velox DSM 12556]|uniref:Permease component of ribose/xylose/arabinose/galactoside ABC-type transporter n=1 Tax=Thermanaerovibrio velox DSM 12556 TaxID=926567 RepID=H0UR26_9BACT|nr:ABC transporter permease [Thermanaerovibrio velox]EHM10863.1 permease component of ribose/xylose/arabinose/galactoside ABC-type transporter [Thermanaerovibrio velox DSM 12556]MCX7828196.1 ABC transporter permease [Thermanaerothrix sp.]